MLGYAFLFPIRQCRAYQESVQWTFKSAILYIPWTNLISLSINPVWILLRCHGNRTSLYSLEATVTE